MFAVQIQGGKELAATLNQLSIRMRRKFLTEALAEIAEPMRARASQLAPHAPGAPDLRENIIVSRKDRTLDEGGGLVKQGEFQATVAMGPSRDFFYGFYQEFGTVHHGASPFMRPAFDGDAPKAIARFVDIVWRELAGKKIFKPTQVSDAPFSESGGTGGTGGAGLGAGTQARRGGTGL